MHVVVDTNVLVVANGIPSQASPQCIINCSQRLSKIQTEDIVVLDDHWLILKEYMNNVSHTGQPGVGDAFLKWVLTNQANTKYCEQVPITAQGGDHFKEFPTDTALAGFDPSDRKFVAVALSHSRNPPIFNAVDSDWRNFREALSNCGVCIEFLCPELLARQRS